MLLVIFCGLLFSGISQGVSLAKLAPSANFFDSLAIGPGVMVTHEKYGFWVESAGHRVVIDPLLDNPAQEEDVLRLLNTTDLDLARALFEKYNVSYVLITPEMENGLFWEREGQGLSFLTSNTDVFKQLSDVKGVRVWEVSWKRKSK